MPGSRRPDEAERRQVTVMFTDLVGSTALSSAWTRKICEMYLPLIRAVPETVNKFGGNVTQYMGDGILDYLGYPHAHENDADAQ